MVRRVILLGTSCFHDNHISTDMFFSNNWKFLVEQNLSSRLLFLHILGMFSIILLTLISFESFLVASEKSRNPRWLLFKNHHHHYHDANHQHDVNHDVSMIRRQSPHVAYVKGYIFYPLLAVDDQKKARSK